MSPFMDFFRIVGYTEGFRSYRIGLLAFLALCRKMISPQILNANPTKSPNLEFGQLVGFRPLHKSRKYWALLGQNGECKANVARQIQMDGREPKSIAKFVFPNAMKSQSGECMSNCKLKGLDGFERGTSCLRFFFARTRK